MTFRPLYIICELEKYRRLYENHPDNEHPLFSVYLLRICIKTDQRSVLVGFYIMRKSTMSIFLQVYRATLSVIREILQCSNRSILYNAEKKELLRINKQYGTYV